MSAVIDIKNVSKTYEGGFQALKNINLQVQKGEIFALLGPNGAGKTTLISTICGITRLIEGEIKVGGFDINKNPSQARSLIGLVPQEIALGAFETVWATVKFSRGLFNKPSNPEHIETVLKKLTLDDKKNSKLMTLSGGMKRRVMIAKALSHEPMVLFLDEPTAGVDVELRKDMWQQVAELRSMGVTIVLTTHYIEEAEEMADRVGVISKGELVVVEEKKALMQKLGKKEIVLDLKSPISAIPDALSGFDLQMLDHGHQVKYTFDSRDKHTCVSTLMYRLHHEGLEFKDLKTRESSLEEIFVNLISEDKSA